MPLKNSDICVLQREATGLRNLFSGIDAWGPIKFKNSGSGITEGIDHLCIRY
jgi:hypothetical protein